MVSMSYTRAAIRFKYPITAGERFSKAASTLQDTMLVRFLVSVDILPLVQSQMSRLPLADMCPSSAVPADQFVEDDEVVGVSGFGHQATLYIEMGQLVMCLKSTLLYLGLPLADYPLRLGNLCGRHIFGHHVARLSSFPVTLSRCEAEPHVCVNGILFNALASGI